ncbi:MAG TPA: adenylate/guanylate cyclase domain-containing protein [Methylomirabilota bacterium]|jgi:class 3 adenylate cyclase|nr:adenylate/guanylate cyclase domain-containing protein [Methylomirabilota bacterium]
MPVLSFRLKLVLAMMLAVAGVSTTTLFVTERRVQAYYEQMFRAQFQRQISYFTSLQEARLGVVREQCLKLTQSVRLIAALKEPETELPLVYEVAEGELRGVLSEVRTEPGAAPIPEPKRFRATFLRFLDARGKPIPPPENLQTRFAALAPKPRLDQNLSFVRETLADAELQQVGYLGVTHDARPFNTPRLAARAKNPEGGQTLDAEALQEVIVTKVVDPIDGKMAGALVLGFPLPELVPQPRARPGSDPAKHLEAIQNGVFLEGRLYADTNLISEATEVEVAHLVGPRVHAEPRPEADFNCEILQVPYRVFYALLNDRSVFAPAYQVYLYSMEEARQAQRDLRYKILGWSAVAMVGALLLSFLLSNGLTVPIRELVTGTAEISGGNLGVRVPVRSRDEIGQLAESFNNMAAGLAQKDVYRRCLNLVADEKVAKQLVSGEISLGGSVQDVSVLFCDIRGFTPLTQYMPPDEVIAMINEHMTALTAVVKKHNGVLDKFVGDLLMAVFGAPVRHENDTLAAGRCALGLLEERQKLNQTARHRLQVRVGLATGPVVAGCIGSVDRLNYTVLGERVNLASRLCTHAEDGEVLIDQTTKERLNGLLVVEPAAAMHLKGFDKPVDVYRLIALKT